MAETLMQQLALQGFAVADGCMPEPIWQALADEARSLARAGDLDEAGIGRGDRQRTLSRVRRTSIAWLDGGTPAQSALLAFAEDLRRSINRSLFLGLFEFEAHFAHYPPGGFYARHLDAFRQDRAVAPTSALGRAGARSRVVSFVAFLNEAWGAEDGGELVLWDDVPQEDGIPLFDRLDARPPVLTLAPTGGRLVLMLSEQIPHEVLPTKRDRFAIAGWWRVNASVAGVVDPAL